MDDDSVIEPENAVDLSIVVFQLFVPLPLPHLARNVPHHVWCFWAAVLAHHSRRAVQVNPAKFFDDLNASRCRTWYIKCHNQHHPVVEVHVPVLPKLSALLLLSFSMDSHVKNSFM